MSQGIEKIVLKRFRGATHTTEIGFDATKLVVMIFGENGSGKSSIIDAIDFVCNKNVGSLGERSSTRPKDHLPAIGYSTADMAVELFSEGSSWIGKYAGNKIAILGPDSPPPVAHILRRSQLLRLIEAQPAKRYEELKRFIDVSGIESSEAALSNALRNAEASLASAITARQEAEDTLDQLWEAERSPDATHRTAGEWASSRLLADADEKNQAIQRLNGRIEAVEAAQRLRATCETLLASYEDSLAEAARQREVVDTLAQELESSAPVESDADAEQPLIPLLQRAQEYMVAHSPEACPVCRHAVQPDRLRAEIGDRIARVRGHLERLDAYHRMGAALTGEAAKLRAMEAQAERNRGKIHLALDSLETALEDAGHTDAFAPRSPDSSAAPEGEGFEATYREHERILEGLASMKVSFGEQRARLAADLSQRNSIRLLLKRVEENKQKTGELDDTARQLKKAFQIVRENRLRYTQGVLEGVSDECNRLYERLHPGESLGLSRFRMDEKAKGSLHQDAHFQGHPDVPPQAYFSDSHLDTLGFCLFLALARLYSGSDGIIILDDVFTSVDNVHLRRVFDLLAEESRRFRQIIVTTHVRQWHDYYRYHLGPSNQTELIELDSWSRQGGINPYKSKLSMVSLEEKLAARPFDRQAVASHAGVLLEAVLDQLTMSCGCSMPRKAEGYTLGELCDGLRKISRQLKVTRSALNGDGLEDAAAAPEVVTLEPYFEAVKELGFIRNRVGCHFNADGQDLSNGEVESLAQRTLDLLAQLVCRTCGEIPSKNRSTHFDCRCKTTRLEPTRLA